MTQETATLVVIGTITQSGNALCVVTSAYIPTSPVSVSVPVTAGMTVADVANQARYYLATTATISAEFATNGTAANVTLIDHQSRANDASLQISIADDTCIGLTPAVSAIIVTGSGLTNAYCTLAEAKAYARITTTDVPDDAIIEALINSASRYIDTEAQQTFYESTETRLFDMPIMQVLYLDKALQSITTLTNGDGSIIPSTAYALIPANDLPKNSIRLLPSTSIGWRAGANGNPFQCISILGLWGEPCPADIREACLVIFKAAYNRRFGENMNSITTITQGGLIVTPEDVPAKALQIIHNHRRIVFG